MTWLFLLLAMVVLALAVGVVTGRISGAMRPPETSLSFRGLPEDVVPEALGTLRFDAALRGYRMEQVDAVIDRLVDELRRRDEEIALLRGISPSGPDGIEGMPDPDEPDSGEPDPDAPSPEVLTAGAPRPEAPPTGGPCPEVLDLDGPGAEASGPEASGDRGA
ncbi:MAG: hypothetical protein QG622_3675 [Actinomycetota bacterium]|nr:hypothetical protein [Actinomycetota bacterium]